MARTPEEISHFISKTAFAGAQLQPLAGDASSRRYVRAVLGEKSAMIMDSPAEGENFQAFVTIAEYLYSNGYSAPEILARNMAAGLLLLEDFGDESFSRVVSKNPSQETKLYEAAIDLLAQWQSLPSIALPCYNLELYMREVTLFCDWFLPKILGAEKSASLRTEYLAIWQGILANAPLAQNIFVHRDFHADNLMWLPSRAGAKRLGLLDFQDGVIGDAAYDMVSLLEDARRDVPSELAQEMIARYLAKTGADAARFNTAYSVLGAQRNSKIIGIFVRLAVRDGKQNYLQYLPRVWGYLERDLEHQNLAPLREWLDKNIPARLRHEVGQ